MSEAPRQFAPGGHSFGLHQALFLRGKRLRHVIEGFGELADLIAPVNVNARVPSSGCHFARTGGKFLQGAPVFAVEVRSEGDY